MATKKKTKTFLEMANEYDEQSGRTFTSNYGRTKSGSNSFFEKAAEWDRQSENSRKINSYNSLLKNYNNLVKNYYQKSDNYNKEGPYHSNSAEFRQEMDTSRYEIYDVAEKLKSELKANENEFGSDYVKEILSQLQTDKKNIGSIMISAERSDVFSSKWKNADEYNKDVRQSSYYEKYKDMSAVDQETARNKLNTTIRRASNNGDTEAEKAAREELDFLETYGSTGSQIAGAQNKYYDLTNRINDIDAEIENLKIEFRPEAAEDTVYIEKSQKNRLSELEAEKKELEEQRAYYSQLMSGKDSYSAEYEDKYSSSDDESQASAIAELQKEKEFYNNKGYTEEAERIQKEIDYLYHHGTVNSQYLGRIDKYEQNEKEIELLNKKLADLDSEVQSRQSGGYTEEESAQLKQLKDRRDTLIAENNQYKRSEQGKADEYYEVTKADDFEEMSAVGAAIENPTIEEISSYETAIDPMHQLEGEDYWNNVLSNVPKVTNKLEFYFSNRDYVIGHPIDNSISPVEGYQDAMKGASRNWDYFEETERKTYNYILATEGEEAADAYLDSMQVILDRRANEEIQKNMSESVNKPGIEGAINRLGLSVASVPLNVFGGAFALLDDAASAIRGEYNPYSPGHAMMLTGQNARNAVAQKYAEDSPLEIMGQNVAGQIYNALMSSADSVLGAATMGRMYTIVMGSSAASTHARELYEKGATGSQIFFGSLTAGVAEALFEYVSIDKLLTERNIESIMQAVKAILVQSGVEATEEIFTDISNLITDNIVMGVNSDYEQAAAEYEQKGYSRSDALRMALIDAVKETAWSGISGALSGGFSGTVFTGAQAYGNYKTGEAIRAAGNENAVLSAAQSEFAGEEANTIAANINKKGAATNMQLGALKTAIQQGAIKSYDDLVNEFADAGDIKADLVESGMDEKAASKKANTISKIIKGENVSARAEAEIRNDPIARDVISNYEQTINLVTALSGIDSVYNTASEATQDSRSKYSKKKTVWDEPERLDVSEGENEGKTILKDTGEEIGGYEIVDTDDGALALKLDNGATVDIGDVSFASNKEAAMIEMFSDAGASAETVNALMKSYDENAGVAHGVWTKAITDVYDYGVIGASKQYMQNGAQYIDSLTEEQINLAYERGRADRAARVEARKKLIKGLRAGVKVNRKTGTRLSDDAITNKEFQKINEKGGTQKDRKLASMKLVHNLAKALGVRVTFYASELGTDGNRYYIDENGNRKLAPNGKYSANGEIFIDINSGKAGEGTIIYTLAHELTHFIKDWSPEKFKVLSEMLLEKYAEKGYSVTYLVDIQIENAKKEGRKISRDVALEEVVADSCETFLTDKNVLQTLQEIKQKDTSLFGKIKDFFSKAIKALEKVIGLYDGVETNSQDGKIVAKWKEELADFKRIYAEGLADASDNYSYSKQKNNTSEGVRYQLRGVNKDGIEVYETSAEVMNLTWSERVSKYEDMLVNEYSGRVARFVRNGHTYFAKLDPDNPFKSLHGERHYTTNGKKAIIKAGADGNLFDIISETKYSDSNKDNKNHKQKDGFTDYFDYFVKTIQIDNKVFDLNVTVKKQYGVKNGYTYTLFLRDNKNIKASPPLNSTKDGALKVGGNASTYSISQPDAKINHSDKNSSPSDEKLSSRSSNIYDEVGELERLRKENAELQDDVEGLKQLIKLQKTVTKGTMKTPTAVQHAAKELMEKYGVKSNKDNLASLMNQLSAFYTSVATTENVGDLSWDDVQNQLEPVARWIVDNGTVSPVHPGLELSDSERAALNDYFETELLRDAVQSIYDTYWRATTLYTTADKHGMKIDALKAEHKKAMSKLRADKNTRIEAIKAEDKEYYHNMISRLREKKNARIDETKKHASEMRLKGIENRKQIQLRNKIKKLADEMSRSLLKPTETNYVPQSLVRATAEALKELTYAFDTGKSANRTQIFFSLIEEYESIKDKSQYAGAYDRGISEMLRELPEILDKPLTEMSSYELTNVYNTFKGLQHTIRESVRMTASQINQTSYEFAADAIKETRAVKPSRSNVWNRYILTQLRPETAFDTFGGHAKNNHYLQLYDMLNQGQHDMLTFEMEAKRIFADLINDKNGMKKLYSTKENDLVDIGLKDDNGNAVKITHGMLCELYKLLLNPDSARHVAIGGLHIPDLARYYGGKDNAYGVGSVLAHGTVKSVAESQKRIDELTSQINEARKAKNRSKVEELKRTREVLQTDLYQIVDQYTNNLRSRVERAMSDFDKKWAEASHEFFDGYSKEKLNETTMKRYGFEKATVDYYYPIATDSNFHKSKDSDTAKPMTLDGVGFMKDRIVGASNPIYLGDISFTVTQQIEKSARYYGLAVPLWNLSKVLDVQLPNYADSVQLALKQTFDGRAWNYISDLRQDLAGSRTTIEDVFAKLRGNMAQSSLTLNARVSLVQSASYPTAAAEIGFEPLIKALKSIKRNAMFSKEERAIIESVSPLLSKRLQGFLDADIGDAKSLLSPKKRAFKKVKWLMGWIEAVDGFTVAQLWLASKEYVKKHNPELAVDSKEYLQAVGIKFNEVVEKTQPNYTTLQRPDLLRTNNPMLRSLAMFYTQRLQNFNIVFDSAARLTKYRSDYKNGINGVTQADVKEAGARFAKAITSQVIASMTIAVFQALADGLLHKWDDYRDEEGEINLASFIKGFLINWTESLAGNMFLGAELYSIIKYLIDKACGNDAYISDALTVGGVDSVNSLISSALGIFSSARSIIQKAGSDEEITRQDIEKPVRSFANSLGQVIGIPINNFGKILDAFYNWANDIMNGEFMESGYDRSSKEYSSALYDAMLADDKEKIEKYKKYYKDADAMHAAIRSQLRKKDERIKEAAQMLFDRDVTGAKEIEREIIDEGHFSQSDILAAVNSELNVLKTKQEEEEAEKEKQEEIENGTYKEWWEKEPDGKTEEGSFYSASDLNLALEGNDLNAVKEALKELRNKKMAEGKTEKEADGEIRQAVTSYWKPKYQKAVEDKDTVALSKVYSVMEATKLYGSNVKDYASKHWTDKDK